MKKILFALALVACACLTTSCVDRGTVYNYKNSVVVNKSASRSQLTLRVQKHNHYEIIKLDVQRGEFIQFNIGDTIR